MIWEFTLCQPRLSELSPWMPAIQDCLLAGTFKPTLALKGTTTKNGLLGCVHLQGRLQRTPFTRAQQCPSWQRQGCRFLICLLSRAQGNKGIPSQHHSTIPGWSRQSSLKYDYKGVKIHSCWVVLSSISENSQLKGASTALVRSQNSRRQSLGKK